MLMFPAGRAAGLTINKLFDGIIRGNDRLSGQIRLQGLQFASEYNLARNDLDKFLHG
jgi:hypothetical protein